MSRYVAPLAKLIEHNDKEKCQEMCIRNLPFQKLQPATKLLLEEYGKLKVLRIVNCDLRNFDNFPRLLSLTRLDASNNKLQGTFHQLVPLRNLKHLDVSSNIIPTARNLFALQRIKGLTVVVIDNPFLQIEADWKDIVSTFDLDVEDTAGGDCSLRDSWMRVKEQSEMERLKYKMVKKTQLEDREMFERERLRESQKTLQHFLEMVQRSQSQVDNDLAWPRRDLPSRSMNRRVFQHLGSEQFFANPTDLTFTNVPVRINSPRQDDIRRYMNDLDMSEGDYGHMDDRYSIGSEQY